MLLCAVTKQHYAFCCSSPRKDCSNIVLHARACNETISQIPGVLRTDGICPQYNQIFTSPDVETEETCSRAYLTNSKETNYMPSNKRYCDDTELNLTLTDFHIYLIKFASRNQVLV